MPHNLVIVESPIKAKTIEKYLGKDFEVLSSFGHIVDLPKKDMGIEISNNFNPLYQISIDKIDIVKKLKKHAEKSNIVWLASDEDREGEAIAWHLFNELNLTKEKTKRIVFHEITKKAIKRAIENPRDINKNLVNAQKARRVLDRIVGFEISPVLWKKIRIGLSAGRVQSVALRLIVEKEKNIKNFISTCKYRVEGLFSIKNKKELLMKLEVDFKSKEYSLEFLEKCKNQFFIISDIEIIINKRSPASPFTTSTLQQESSLKLGMNLSRTMLIAQKLYEEGLITYMRTDSNNLSEDALYDAEKIIKNKFGDKYYKYRKYKTKSKSAQEAHEAIRPTNLKIEIIDGDYDQIKLYKLIWKRTIASQMKDAKLKTTIVKLTNNNIKEKFFNKNQVIIFEGFTKVYNDYPDLDEKEKKNQIINNIKIGDKLKYLYIEIKQNFSNPISRYTEASLVKKLEELGIGRPSTYAPTISTIQQRNYVIKGNYNGHKKKYEKIVLYNNEIKESLFTKLLGVDKNKLIPTDIGIIVSNFLIENFGKILEYNFTAKIEERFDQIAEGNEEWTNMLKDFYIDFHANVEDVKKNVDRIQSNRILGKEPITKKNIYVKVGKYGPFLQIGEMDEKDKPRFASLPKNYNIYNITLDEALQIFKLPRKLGYYNNEILEINNGKFGPYIKYKDSYYALSNNFSPTKITLEEAINIINKKNNEILPIHNYKNHDIIKGKGKFGPFIKWNGLFINIPKKYDFNNLSTKEIEILIEEKEEKEKNKIIKNWEKEGIKIEKGRWKTSIIKKGNIKIILPKHINSKELTLIEVKKIIAKKK